MPAEPSLRFGVVGVGKRGRKHLQVIYEQTRRADASEHSASGRRERTDEPRETYWEFSGATPDPSESADQIGAEIAAICDPSPEARAAAADICAECGDDPAAYESFDAFLADAGDAYDVAVVASPNHMHAEHVCALLEEEVDTFSEKPLATTLADHDRIVDAADRSAATFYVGFNLRHSPLYRRLYEFVDRGAVGDLGMLTAQEVREPFPHGHYYSQDESGGSLLEKDCHDFDLFNWIAGADPVRVAAFGGQHVLTEGTDVNDHANVVVEYDDGTKATLELCLYAPFTQERGRLYSARGSDGVIRSPLDDPDAWALYTRETRDTFAVTDTEGGHGGADARMWRHALRAFLGDADPPATARDAKKAAVIAIAAETAISEGRIVGIDENYDLRQARERPSR